MAAAAGARDRLYGTIYGQCIGDAVGLLTEFMTRNQAAQVDKSTVCDFAHRLYRWSVEGFPELGDKSGCVLEQTTQRVLRQKNFTQDPHYAALQVWQKAGGTSAPNGAIMRTSILGVHGYKNLQTVVSNTRAFCLATHADPRCVASCVAMTTAMALMLQGWRDVSEIARESFEHAQAQLPAGRDAMRQELMTFLQVRDLRTLKLDETETVGYTYKALGAGFWALRQRNFRDTIIQIAMECVFEPQGGSAATNSAVAGALLGCRLGVDRLRGPWLYGLRHKHWLDDQIQTYLRAVNVFQLSQGGAKRPKQQPEVDQWLTDIIEREKRDKNGEKEQTDGETHGQTHGVETKSHGKNELPTPSGRPQMVIGFPMESSQSNIHSPSLPDLERPSLERVSTTEWEGDGRKSLSEKDQKGPVGQPLRLSPLQRDGRTSSGGDQRVRTRYADGKPTGPRLGPLSEYIGRVNPEHFEKKTGGDLSYTRPPTLTERTISPQDRRDMNQHGKLTTSLSPRPSVDAEESIPMRPHRATAPLYSSQLSSPLSGHVRVTGNLSRHTRHSLPSDLKSLLRQSEEGVHKLNSTRMRSEERGTSGDQRSSSLPSDREYASDTALTGLERVKHFHPSLSLSSGHSEQGRVESRRARSDDAYVRQQGRTLPYTRTVSPARHVRFSSHR
ncbi:hypothetical protein Bbelb_103190 [Branchiostoma belcheri]|nr:hypothetical protein Bbelb_103190 [Branchiostoma belcheri]